MKDKKKFLVILTLVTITIITGILIGAYIVYQKKIEVIPGDNFYVQYGKIKLDSAGTYASYIEDNKIKKDEMRGTVDPDGSFINLGKRDDVYYSVTFSNPSSKLKKAKDCQVKSIYIEKNGEENFSINGVTVKTREDAEKLLHKGDNTKKADKKTANYIYKEKVYGMKYKEGVTVYYAKDDNSRTDNIIGILWEKE